MTHQGSEGVPAPSVGVDDVLGHFEWQTGHGSDPFVHSLSRRIVDLTGRPNSALGDRMRAAIARSLASHPFYRASDHTRVVERSLMAHQLWLEKPNFLDHIDKNKPEDWDGPIVDTFTAESADLGRYHETIFNQLLDMHVLTNDHQRSLFIKLEAFLDEMRSPLKLIEMGASQLHNGLKLRHLYRFPFRQPVQIVKPSKDPTKSPKPIAEDSKLFTTIAQRLAFGLGAYVGIDENDPRESMIQAKCAGDTVKPIDRFNRDPSLKEFHALQRQQKRQPGIDFHVADCAQPIDQERFFAEHPEMDGGADLIFISFMLYEVPEQYWPVVLENAFKLAHPEHGRVMIIDNLHITPDGQITKSEKQDAYSTGVYVFDNAKPNLGWQLRYTLETGRGRKIITEPAIGNLALAPSLNLHSSRPDAA